MVPGMLKGEDVHLEKVGTPARVERPCAGEADVAELPENLNRSGLLVSGLRKQPKISRVRATELAPRLALLYCWQDLAAIDVL